MPFRGVRVAVADVRSVVATARDAEYFILTNRDATDSVYLGDVTVTAANGYELKPGESVEVQLDGEDSAYGICSGGLAASVHVLKS